MRKNESKQAAAYRSKKQAHAGKRRSFTKKGPGRHARLGEPQGGKLVEKAQLRELTKCH